MSIFPNAKLGEIQRFPAGAHGVEGSVMTASFELGGQQVVALNGNKRHGFSPASSLLVFCKDAGEAESVSVKLAAGGQRRPGRMAQGSLSSFLAVAPPGPPATASA